MQDVSLHQRFEQQYVPEPNSGCWLWLGHVPTKYGTMSVGGKSVRAHRLSFEMHKGPIPDGLYVCHTCDVPTCVNPDHLFLGTHLENMQDMARKGRNLKNNSLAAPGKVTRPKGERHSQAKVSQRDIEAIRARHAAGERQADLAKTFGLHRTQVCRIVNNKSWAA